MKSLYYSQKPFLCVVLSLFLSLCVLFNCSTPSGESTSTDPHQAGTNGDEDSNNELALSCRLPKCSGSKCCDEEDEECQDYCEDHNFLDLSGEGREKCLTLEKKFLGEKLTVLFSDILGDPDEEKLIKSIHQEELEIICGAVKELGVDVLENQIKDSSPYQAELILNLMGTKRSAIEIFKQTKDKKEGIKLFKKLLENTQNSSTTSTSEAKIIKAFKEKNEFEDKNETILERALNQNNKDFVLYVHNNIVKDEDQGLCGSDSEKNHPEPSNRHYLTEDTLSSAKKRSRPACLLAFYCYIDNTKEGDQWRKRTAQLLRESSVQTLIRSPKEQGGLAIISTKAQKEWPENVCKTLKMYWDNGALNLGLSGTGI